MARVKGDIPDKTIIRIVLPTQAPTMSLVTMTFALLMSAIASDHLTSPQHTENPSSLELTSTLDGATSDWLFIYLGKISVAITSYGYIVVGGLSIAGNVLNAIIMGRQKSISPYAYLTAIAVCDLGIGFTLIWMGVVSNVELQRKQRFIADAAAVTSVAMYFVREWCDLSALYLTVALSMDRLVAVKFPLRRSGWCRVKTACVTCGVIMTSGLLLATHFLIRLKITWLPDVESGLDLPNMSYTRIGRTQVVNDTVLYASLLLKMVLPLAVMAACNMMTLRQIVRGEKFRMTSSATQKSRAATGTQCLAITVGVIVTYFVTGIPQLTFNVYVSIYGYPKTLTPSTAFLAMFAELLAWTKCCTNFFIYTILNRKFRDDLIDLFRLRSTRGDIDNHPGIQIT
ncbi:hypothetical protein CAPTEDRAFT_193837 [Capitella teleta]|uniref:G-protein coupled receptors family 1 profile domain-containing protein n=1 Tax=Capitella teleta TaxID=283909 RepID=R7V6P2_CAPTE|nr:hypothetical protein CAPTEDRAFT_193837 [Capitella teleta]|eukprot:ELU11435.1 hypothetical protein CAPTEDRAFT_193837 [Capitella teleta]